MNLFLGGIDLDIYYIPNYSNNNSYYLSHPPKKTVRSRGNRIVQGEIKMSVQIHCPYCNQKYDLDEFMEGAKVECAKCSQKFTLDMMLVDANDRAPEKPPRSTPVPVAKPVGTQHYKKDSEQNEVEGEKKERPAFASMPARIQSIGLTNVLLIAIAVLLVVLCTGMFKTNKQMSRTDEQMSEISDKLDALSTKSNPITGYKLVDYTWEYPSLMEMEFRNAIDEGYEPAGLISLNSLKGGIFLFVKRKK